MERKGITLEAEDILDAAIRMEEAGEEFYRSTAAKLEDEDARKTFSFLADEEIKHKEMFSKMRSKLGDVPAEKSLQDAYVAYMRSFMKNVIFPQEMMEKQMLKAVDLVSAIELGIGRETASILYYEEMKKFVPADGQDTVEKVIEEERAHFTKLTALKNRS